MKNIKMILFFVFLFFRVANSYAGFFFVPGHLLFGISGGGGGSDYTYGTIGGTINLNAEIIFNTWYITPDVEISVGSLANGSAFFGRDLAQGGLSLMPTFHVSFFERADWFFGIGFGISMHKNLVLYGVGLSTGFNIKVQEWFLVTMSFEIQGPQIFGAIGVKFRIEAMS